MTKPGIPYLLFAAPVWVPHRLVERRRAENLERLANKKIPAAMHLLGHALWEVVEDSADVDRRSFYLSCCYGVAFCDGGLSVQCTQGAGCKRSLRRHLVVPALETPGWMDEFAPKALGR